jgi:RimJ/RimL family protein N-acetyltransferase
MIADENFIDFKCPYCDGTASFPRETSGSVQECPLCQESLVVPKAGDEVGHKIPIPIIAPRLVLRRFAPGDWKSLMEMIADEAAFQAVEGLPGGGEEEVIRWLASDSHIKLTMPNQMFHLAIALRDNDALMGYVGLWFTDAQRLQAMFNISLHQKHQRKGYAREALKALLGFCFEGIRLHRLTARCDSRSAAACRLCENAGMRREGEFVKDQRLIDGGWANSVWYAVLEEDYAGPARPVGAEVK